MSDEHPAVNRSSALSLLRLSAAAQMRNKVLQRLGMVAVANDGDNARQRSRIWQKPLRTFGLRTIVVPLRDADWPRRNGAECA